MPFMRPLIVFIIFCIITSPTKAQSVKGSWYAVGHIQMDGNTENYLTELILKGDSNSKGEFNYYFRDSLFKNKINYTGVAIECINAMCCIFHFKFTLQFTNA